MIKKYIWALTLIAANFYNYLCSQCLSLLMLWVRISIRTRRTTLCEKVCQWLETGRWSSPVSSTNKTDHHDITEILLKVALTTIKQTGHFFILYHYHIFKTNLIKIISLIYSVYWYVASWEKYLKILHSGSHCMWPYVMNI